MADGTKIEWTDATWTPIRARHKATGKVGWHCEHASPGCVNCYSEDLNAKRFGTGLPFKPGHRDDVEHFLDEAMLTQPLRWRRPRMVFVCSMTDLFGDWVSDEWIDRVFASMALAPQHTFQVLTKRADRMRAYLRDERTPGRIARVLIDQCLIHRNWPVPPGDHWPVRSIGDIDDPSDVTIDLPLPHVWLGVSAEDQRRADERIPALLDTPASVRWVSAEPLLGPMNLEPWLAWEDDELPNGETWGCPGCEDSFNGGGGCDCPNRKAIFSYEEGPVGDDGSPQWIAETRVTLDWIVAGGESGLGARPMHPAWVRSIRDQCAAAGVPFLFKQWGAWAHSEQAPAPVPGPSFFDTDGRPTGDGWHFWTDGDQGADASIRVGKKAAGRLLDGVEHDDFPRVQP